MPTVRSPTVRNVNRKTDTTETLPWRALKSNRCKVGPLTSFGFSLSTMHTQSETECVQKTISMSLSTGSTYFIFHIIGFDRFLSECLPRL